MPTWAFEQALLVVLLVPGAVLGLQADPTLRGAVRVVGGFVGALGGQKLRSGADRRREQDELRGVRPAALRCDRYLARWAIVVQVVAVVTATAGALTGSSPWAFLASALPLAYALLYGSWRAWYRRRWPASSEEP